VGNTCYLNSAFQALRFAGPFASLFGDNKWARYAHPERNGADLAKETASLVQALQAPGDGMVHSAKFARAFIQFAQEINDEIRYGAQADAAEAIQILLDGLHTQLAREVRMEINGSPHTSDHEELIKSLESWAGFFRKEYSALVDAFYGQTQSRVICGSCNAKSTRYEPWSVLKAPIPGAEKAGSPAPTLQECLRATFAAETIDDYACDACKKRGPARIEHAISRFPSHLILSLKRFTNTGAKVRARIPYDENSIDFSAWRAWTSIQEPQRYRVVSTVEHLGSSRGGHYIMRTRTPTEWLIYDDGSVSPSSSGGAAAPDTYVLILERIK
jgi:ubiquitin C-terminal hydrolase